MKISVCGKGGSGKSTLVSLLANQAQARGLKTLVVDSDESNSGLFRMLGFDKPPIPLMELVGGKRKLKEKLSEKSIFGETQIFTRDIPSEYIQKSDGLMLVGIGKILHSLEGCACPMGVLSREFLRKLKLTEEEIALIDMEAGVEHFGRGVDESIDSVLLVVEPSFESIEVAEKVKSLASGIHKNVRAVLNKVASDGIASRLTEQLKAKQIEIIGSIPNDATVFEACLEGKALKEGKALESAGKILDSLLSS
ncbi:MAG: ATP-binding protein [Deltaproteobacteria bacterium]|nr:ATP-binding protein [Deltaproteobacteria bacterium]